MSAELISVLVAVPGNRGDLGRADPDQQSRVAGRTIRQDMARLESRLDERINGLESRFDAMEKQFGELRERMARTLEDCWKGCERPSGDGLRPAKDGKSHAGQAASAPQQLHRTPLRPRRK